MSKIPGSAATALLTWLLLQPPIIGGAAAPGAPLGTWIVNGRFATSQACEQTRAQNRAALAYGEAMDGVNAQGLANRAIITAAICMSQESLRAALAPPTATPDR